MSAPAAERRDEQVHRLTIAQSIRRSSDPYQASIASFTRRQADDYRKTFYFEDGSHLVFDVTYTAVEDGME